MNGTFVQTRDLRMHYLQSGTGEPVVFIHGFPETSYEWRHQLEHFETQLPIGQLRQQILSNLDLFDRADRDTVWIVPVLITLLTGDTTELMKL